MNEDLRIMYAGLSDEDKAAALIKMDELLAESKHHYDKKKKKYKNKK